VSTASDPAGRRCPDAVFLPADNPAYKAASEDVMAVLRSFGPGAGAVVEVMGWDEAFVGVTTDGPEGLARRIQGGGAHADPAEVLGRRRRQLLRVKIGSEFAKPPVRDDGGACIGTGVFGLTGQNWDAVMGDRSTRALWGIGAKTACKLAECGLYTVRELAAADPAALAADLGRASAGGTSSWGAVSGLWRCAASRGCPAPAATRRPSPPTSPNGPRYGRRPQGSLAG
jgi:DNA polymerase-4